ncbi:agmatinase [Phaeobacter inhibens]|uniref:Guanidinobutyrase n=1 Tax=Phaeobacter inhibens TaxID=221822 RepID=A0A2I7LTL0_9RHOB|nr:MULTISPECIES: agmatinase [Phaeobacter]AFO89779.1 guanidinobutyrase [Phaeobacter inhibens DSM 17395]APX16073.1 agmatinase [Phaeobacter inhibens]AUQ44406.1 guanidinobutyrase [Phaeobacter inhibens]AUQ48387.1 guanidinobutyrase [Phaeobacter inhibens]AUQ55843.1 guanidinobutyrase [Phaeobacter inhibens]
MASLPTDFFHPVSGMEMPRFAGLPTFMRLPHVTVSDPIIDQVQLGLVGVPWDAGTTNRPGPRHGPRQLRDLSTMIRAGNPVTGINPFSMINCADLGDVAPNPVDIIDCMERISAFYADLKSRDIFALTVGGDHLVSLPVLRGLASGAPVGLIQFDSHTDLFDSYFGGNKYTHGTPFRRAIEEGLVDPKRMVQIGIRGTAYNTEDVEWGQAQGVRIIRIEEFFDRGVSDVMREVREIVGDQPTYCTYDIDFVDPAFAPGTGTPEVGGPNSFQALQVVRELAGVQLVGADLVEVSPPFDTNGNTAWLGASILFEMLCVSAGAISRR